MPDRPVSPPPRKPVQEYLTPNSADGYYTELISREDPAFYNRKPILRGTPYSSMVGAKQSVIDAYPGGLWFCKAIKPGNSADFGNSDRWLILIWATDFLAESQSNAEISYLEEAVSFPAFIRAYTVRRDVYEASTPITPGTPLTALLSVAITAPGVNYITATGAVGNATVSFVCSAGAIISGVVTKEGSGIASGAAITITGDGTGATATARIQPASAVLVSQKKLEFPDDSPFSDDWVRVIRVYKTMPGPILTTQSRSADVRGLLVNTTIQEGLNGTLDPESGNYIISSVTEDLDSVVERRTSRKLNGGVLPADESWAFWDFVPLPLLLFSITNTIYCNGTQNLKVVSNPVTTGGASVLRKHRTTVGYSNTYPNPDLSGSTYITRDVRYQGVFIGFSYSNVLNDAISYSESASYTGVCAWTEAYTFSASTPSATTFAAGVWYVRDYKVEPYGTTGFRWVKTEFYSAAGNPSI